MIKRMFTLCRTMEALRPIMEQFERKSNTEIEEHHKSSGGHYAISPLRQVSAVDVDVLSICQQNCFKTSLVLLRMSHL